ncbi:MAG: glycosyltransferase family 2 protein [Candidatus Hodarchaeota archaeon]
MSISLTFPFISVIICTYFTGRRTFLHKLVDQLLKQPYIMDIILVVDHNPDFFNSLKKEYQNTTKIKLLENQFHQGLSGARNTGILNSTGEILAFLDDDVILTKNWSKSLLEPFLKTERIVGVGGKIIPAWQNKRLWWFSPMLGGIFSSTSHYISEKRTLVPSTTVPTIIGANMAFRKTIFQKVGLFHPILGRKDGKLLAGEEWELCLRIYTRTPSKLIIYDPSVIIYHIIENKRKSIFYLISNAYYTGVSRKIVNLMYPTQFNNFQRFYLTRKELKRTLELLRSSNSRTWQIPSQIIADLILVLFMILGYAFGSQ